MEVWYLLFLSLTFKLIRSENENEKSVHCKNDNTIQGAEYTHEKSYKPLKKPNLASTLGDLKIEIEENRINLHLEIGKLKKHLLTY